MQEVASGASRCPEPLQVCTEKFIYRLFDKNEQYPIYCIYCFIINRGLYIAFCKPAVVPWCANSHGGGEGEEPLAGAFFFFFLSYFSLKTGALASNIHPGSVTLDESFTSPALLPKLMKFIF